MNREEAADILLSVAIYSFQDGYTNAVREALNMAIEALKAKCPTCKWCSDHQESGTRCPIEEHYALPKDGFCHLYKPYKQGVCAEDAERI